MFWWIIISVPFLLLVIALCLPLVLTLSVTNEPNLIVEARANWALWRLKQFRFDSAVAPPAGTQAATATSKPRSATVAKRQPTIEPEQAATKPKAKEKAKQQERLRIPWATIHQLLQKYWSRLWRALHLRCPYGDFYLALDDPACYGWIFGFLGATHLPRPPVHMRVELSHDMAFQASFQLSSRLYPIQWLGLAARIGFEPAVRNIWWSKLRKKGESKGARSQSVHRAAGESHIQQDSNRRSYLSG